MDDVEALLNAALDSYPLQPLPPGFVRRTMGRLPPPVRFQLSFLDVVLPAFLSLCAALLVGLIAAGSARLDPLWLPRLRLWLLLLTLHVSHTPPELLIWAGAGALLAAGALLLGVVSLARPGYRPGPG